MNIVYATLLALIISSGSLFSQEVGQIDPEIDLFDLEIQLDDEDMDLAPAELDNKSQQPTEPIILNCGTVVDVEDLSEVDNDSDESEDLD